MLRLNEVTTAEADTARVISVGPGTSSSMVTRESHGKPNRWQNSTTLVESDSGVQKLGTV
jgi:hypothetical protein